MPLNRPRIWITRTQKQASTLDAQLQALGAETILIPTIEIAAPLSFNALDDAITALSNPANSFDWLIFTSANAVHSLAERAQQQKSSLYPKHIAVIGPATAKAVNESGIVPQIGPLLLPKGYVAESLAAALIQHSSGAPRHHLLVRAEDARDTLPAMLQSAGDRVTIAAAYRNITPPGTLETLREACALTATYPQVITFTSSSTARNLVSLLASIGHTIPPGAALASIGPVTSATLCELGLEPSFEAIEPSVESLVAAIASHLKLG